RLSFRLSLHDALPISAHGRNVRHNSLGCLGLPGAALSADDDGLRSLLREHGLEGLLGETKHVRGDLKRLLSLVRLDVLVVKRAQDRKSTRLNSSHVKI